MQSPGRSSLALRIALIGAFTISTVGRSCGAAPFDLQPILQFSLGTILGQCRAAPVNLGTEQGILLAYCEDAEVDPYVEMFFLPQHRMKLAVVTLAGNELWKKELGAGAIPGIWFTPVFPFDLDGDGTDDEHPLSLKGRRLERLDARMGKTLGQWPWPAVDRNQSPGHTFRSFILGGHVGGKPVLVTAQGTYGPMKIQTRNADMTRRWEHQIDRETPGARGSHMCPIVDINNDGVDEILWGERCIELDTGKELFCGDRDSYRGHSDVVQPVLDRQTNRWFIHTCRESGGVAPRVALFDNTGKRVWGDLDQGHIDMGWTAPTRQTGPSASGPTATPRTPPQPRPGTPTPSIGPIRGLLRQATTW